MTLFLEPLGKKYPAVYTLPVYAIEGLKNALSGDLSRPPNQLQYEADTVRV
jgi:hypothetical protein